MVEAEDHGPPLRGDDGGGRVTIDPAEIVGEPGDDGTGHGEEADSVLNAPQREAFVVAEYLPPAASRVLVDAGCSFADTTGHGHRHPHPGDAIELSEAEARSIAAEGLASRSPWRARLALRDTAKRRDGLLLVHHPVELLEWIAAVPEMRAMHPGVKAYLYCSDPDDILATLPFHPRPLPDGVPSEVLAAGSTLIVCAEVDPLAERPAVR